MSFPPIDTRPSRPSDTHHSEIRANRAVAVALSDRPQSGVSGRVLMFLLLIAAALATFSFSASGQAPNFEEIKLNAFWDDPNNIRKMETAARNYAGTGSADEKYAQFYFEKYVPGRMTQPAALPEMNGMVKNCYSLLSRAQRSGNPRSLRILGWVYKGMKKVAEGNYYPPAKINAVLILGRLDQKAADQIAQTPPVPLSYSLPILIAQYNAPNNVDGVKAAALIGLHRYVTIGWSTLSAADKASIQTIMTDLLNNEPPAGRPEKEHAYLQRYAVDSLDMLRTKEDSALGVQLIGISTEPTKHDLIALHSVRRLGKMGDEMKGKIDDPKDLLGRWSARAVKAFEDELARLADLERPKAAQNQPPRPEEFLAEKTVARQSRPAMMDDEGMDDAMADMAMEESMEDYGAMDEMDGDMGGFGMGYGTLTATANPQPPEIVATRRKLNHVLQVLHEGVTGSQNVGLPRNPGGVLAMVADDKKVVVEDWVLAMEAIVTVLNDDTLDTEKKFIAAITEQLEELRPLAIAEQPVEQDMENVLQPIGAVGAASAPAAAEAPAAADGNVEVLGELASP